MNAMFGSDSRWMISWNGFMPTSTNGTSVSSSVTSSVPISTV
jgi:hypothetical protein